MLDSFNFQHPDNRVYRVHNNLTLLHSPPGPQFWGSLCDSPPSIGGPGGRASSGFADKLF